MSELLIVGIPRAVPSLTCFSCSLHDGHCQLLIREQAERERDTVRELEIERAQALNGQPDRVHTAAGEGQAQVKAKMIWGHSPFLLLIENSHQLQQHPLLLLTGPLTRRIRCNDGKSVFLKKLFRVSAR